MNSASTPSAHDDRRQPLEAALLLNGVFSGVCGFAFMMFSSVLNSWTGFSKYVGDWAIFSVGAILAFYALLLFVLALRPKISGLLVKSAVLLDAGWVLGTIPLLWLPGLTAVGKELIIAVAVIVGGFALIQRQTLGAYRPTIDRSNADELRGVGYTRIWRSWLSMKTWVKIWLFALNVIFIAGVAFLDRGHLAHWVLWVYIAIVPYAFAIMATQNGLTRVLGVVHIVPWTALLAYITVRLMADSALGSQITMAGDPSFAVYLAVLWAAMAFCLFFDYYDLLRWLRGERFVLGTPEAVALGASKATLT